MTLCLQKKQKRCSMSIRASLGLTTFYAVHQVTFTSSDLMAAGTQHFYWGWRVSLGCAIVPAIILFIGSLTLPGAQSMSIPKASTHGRRLRSALVPQMF